MHRTRVVMSPFFSHTRKESVWYGVHPDQDFLWQILPFDIGLPQNSFGYTFQSCSANECSWARRAYLFLRTVPAVNQCAWSQWSIYQLYLCCDYTKGLEGVPHWTGATELTGWWEKCHPHSVRAHTVLTRGPVSLWRHLFVGAVKPSFSLCDRQKGLGYFTWENLVFYYFFFFFGSTIFTALKWAGLSLMSHCSLHQSGLSSAGIGIWLLWVGCWTKWASHDHTVLMNE